MTDLLIEVRDTAVPSNSLDELLGESVIPGRGVSVVAEPSARKLNSKLL
jgi:hypothetical protein